MLADAQPDEKLPEVEVELEEVAVSRREVRFDRAVRRVEEVCRLVGRGRMGPGGRQERAAVGMVEEVVVVVAAVANWDRDM